MKNSTEKPKLKERKWETIMAGTICVAGGYKCESCNVIGVNQYGPCKLCGK